MDSQVDDLKKDVRALVDSLVEAYELKRSSEIAHSIHDAYIANLRSRLTELLNQ